MANANLLKGGVMVVLLLVALAVFDVFDGLSQHKAARGAGAFTGAAVLSSATVSGEFDIRDVVDEGTTKLYTIRGVDYHIEVYDIDTDATGADVVQFIVNGETTDLLKEGSLYVLKYGAQIKVKDILNQQFAEGVHKVEFIFTGASEEQVVATATTNTLTIKANSFAAVALGAAFGSYYNASKSTCSPENIFPASWVYAPSTKYYEETGEPYQNTYENVLLYDLDSNNKLILKPNGHRGDVNKLQPIGKDLTILSWWSEAASAWILNEGPECTLAIKYGSLDRSNTRSSTELDRGINFVSVTPQMVNSRLEQVKGNCDLIGAFSNFGHSVASAPDATPVQDWDWWWPTTHTFTQDELGLGMWLYSDNVCKLSYQ